VEKSRPTFPTSLVSMEPRLSWSVTNKWSSSQGPGIQIGTVVLIRADILPPLQWSISRVIATHVGTDDHVRVVTVRTSREDFKRAQRYLLMAIYWNPLLCTLYNYYHFHYVSNYYLLLQFICIYYCNLYVFIIEIYLYLLLSYLYFV